MAGYTHQVNFEKVFTSGILQGKRYHDYVRFCDEGTARAFMACEGEVVAPRAGNGAYRIEDPILSTLE